MAAILVVGPAWVGDMVMAQSLFMVLRRQQPDLEIDVLAPSWSLPLLQRMPEVRQGIALPAAHGQLAFAMRYRMGRALRHQYEQAIVLPRSFKSALVPFFAHIPVRRGFAGELRYGVLNDIRPLDENIRDQTVKRFVALGMPDATGLQSVHCPSPRLTVDMQNRVQRVAELNLHTQQRVVALMPGAEYGPAKQWPLEYFADLLVQLAIRNIACWILGSAREHAAAERIVQLAGGRGVNLCGRTRLQDAIDLISLADCAVSNDSGLMHIAAAVDRPLVAIYGSSSPKYTPPLTPQAEVLYLNLACSPCFKRQCPLAHLNCLKQISVDSVLAAIGRRMSF